MVVFTHLVTYMKSGLSVMLRSLIYLFVVVVFFKQKTAYEMRISDWSSDVCSSDLIRKHVAQMGHAANISALRIKVNWYYTGIIMNAARHPTSTDRKSVV